VLSGRFDRPATLVVAGAGFGKTTAMVQAFEENRLAPLGTDYWLACETDDANAQHLATGLAATFDIERVDSLDKLLDDVIEACGALTPVEVCLTLDDVHLIPAGSSGAKLLGEVVTRLPSNTHVVFLGRRRPPVALTRLEVTGQCAVVEERDLAFTRDEVSSLAEAHGVECDGDLGNHAGWPALVELTLRHGRPDRFVWEEVIALLDGEQRLVLNGLVALEEAQADLLAEVTGLDELPSLDGIPLVHRRGDSYRAHDLWHELLPDTAVHVDMRRVGVRFLLDRERFDEALTLCLRAQESDSDELTVETAEALRGRLVGFDSPAPAEVRHWLLRLPSALDATPVALLLTGIARRLDSPLGMECDELFSAAATGFIDAGDGDAAVTALSALAFIRTIRRDTAGLIDAFGQLQTLSDAGIGSATPYPKLAATMVATFAEDFPTARDLTAELIAMRLPREVRGIALMMHANALNKLGYDAAPTASEGDALGLALPGIRAISLASRWQAGIVESFVDEPPALDRGDRDAYVSGAWFACVAAAIGDLTTARGLLAEIEARPDEAGRLTQPESLWFAQASVAMLEGRAEDARGIVDKIVDRFPVEGRAAPPYVRGLPVLYQLLREHRSYFDEQPGLGPLYQRDLHLNQAHVALVEVGDHAAVRGVVFPPNAGELLPALGARAAAELLSAAWALDHHRARDMVAGILELIGEFGRDAFRRASGHPSSVVAKGARAILESIPLQPSSTVELRLFGGTKLLIGGSPVETADWRRERVRALLTFLVLNPETTRENVMAALWPDADTASARRSLRSTLNMLHSVLEPGRVAGDAPFFVRSTGQRLSVVSSDALSVDLRRFERLLDHAAALVAAGTPSLSIDPLRAAVNTYRGDLLPDGYDDWVVFARDRLRARYVGAAVRCAELLVATGRSPDAVEVISPVLAVEPWSEPSHRVLVAAHLDHGDVAAARRAMATCHAALVELGGPSEEPTHMLERRLTHRAG
jgi:DNA-binding SARP family transcriptional activator